VIREEDLLASTAGHVDMECKKNLSEIVGTEKSTKDG